MIKRFVAVMLMLVMMISLASCGNDSDFYIDDEYIKNGDIEAVRAIIEYSELKCGGKLLENY